jgi:hypothetical protein
MMPFQVDQSWYEHYWWRDPGPGRVSAFAIFRRILRRLRLPSCRGTQADRQRPRQMAW